MFIRINTQTGLCKVQLRMIYRITGPQKLELVLLSEKDMLFRKRYLDFIIAELKRQKGQNSN